MDRILPVLIDASLPLLSLVLSLAVAYLTNTLKSRMQAGAAKDATIEAMTQAEMVVRDLGQTLKPRLLAASADGHLTEVEAAELKAVALERLEEQLSNAAKRVIKSNGTRLELALSTAIEAAVAKQKEPAPVTIVNHAPSAEKEPEDG